MTQPTMHPALTARERYDLVVMWILVALFLLAVPMMFVHPGMTLLIFWIGFILLGVGTILYRLSFRTTRSGDAAARCACPGCGADLGDALPEGTEQHCADCGAVFRMTEGSPVAVTPGG